jgi:hypothetical protein
VWVILRWLIPNALELAAANAHYWHSDFVMKPRITFHLQLTPAPGQQVFFLALQHRDRPDFLKIAGRIRPRGSAKRRAGHDQPFLTSKIICVGSVVKLISKHYYNPERQ